MPDFNFSLITQLVMQILVGMAGLSLLIFIHEAGHFLMAKKFGVKVRTFSIGFGKSLFSFRKGETDYCIKAIPFGGFVAMAGEQPGEAKTGEDNEFSSQPVPKRMAIALAGPAVNMLFAFLLLFTLYLAGVQEPISNEITVGNVLDDSPAEIAGIQSGDKILELNNNSIKGMEQFLQDIAVEAGNVLTLKVKRDTTEFNVSVTPTMHDMGFAWIGLVPGETYVQVSDVLQGKPAFRAGFEKDDRIVSAQGMLVPDARTFIKIIEASKGEELTVMVLRDSMEIPIPVTPKFDREASKYRIGMGIGMVYHTPTHLVRRGLVASVKKSLDVNLQYSLTIFRFLSGLLKGKVKLKALSGPVGILQVIGNSFRRSFQKFVEFLALISLNLGLVNLLPLIITDGGIILFLLLEAVRRKPLSIKTQMRINQVAISLFITLALFITFHDILKIPLFLN